MSALPLALRIRARHAVERTIRTYFEAAGFIEVQTPTLVHSPGMEPHLRAFAVPTRHCPELGPRYLHTSPEYAIKATFGALDADVFTLARSFRDEPTTRWHHPEFTMLEWYRRCDGLEPVMADVEALMVHAWSAVASVPGPDLVGEPPETPFVRRTVQRAFIDAAGVDPLVADEAALRDAATRLGLAPADAWDAETLFSLLYSFAVEPSLAGDRPVFLTHFPAPQAALARLDPDDPRVALRFEAYAPLDGADGVLELANAFAELTDAAEQRERFAHDRRLRAAEGADTYPIPERMLGGLDAMPTTTGIALGIERLIVWAVASAWGAETSVADYLLGEPPLS